MQAKVYNLAGEEVRSIELEDAIFGIKPNMAVMHAAVLRQQANARQGTHNTKTRADVAGGGRKPWRQKGTGRARQGSIRSPQWTHGGVVFGPHPRSYELNLRRKVRRLAIRSVLSGKVADGQLLLVESFAELEPRTKAMSAALKSLNIGDKTALIFTTGEQNLTQAAGNLPRVKTISAHLLSVVDMLKYDYLVLPLPALDVVNSILSTHGGRTGRALDGIPASGISATATAPAAVATPATASVSVPAESATASTRSAETLVFAPADVAVPAVQASSADEINTNNTPIESTSFPTSGGTDQASGATSTAAEGPGTTPASGVNEATDDTGGPGADIVTGTGNPAAGTTEESEA